MHALDHLTRLHMRLGMRTEIKALPNDKRLWRLAKILRASANRALDAEDLLDAIPFTDRVRRILRDQRRGYRARTIETAAIGAIETNEALERLDAIRWLHRVSYHIWRINVHLAEAHPHAPPAPEAAAPTVAPPNP
jgi:phosphate:Na+ symporter